MSELNVRIKPKKSSVPGEIPVPSDLEVSEIAVNTADGRLFTKHTDLSIVEIGSVNGGGLGQIVQDTSPQLGGDLDVNGYFITSTLGGDVVLSPNTTGNVVLRGRGTSGAGGVRINNENNDNYINVTVPTGNVLQGSYNFVLPPTPGLVGQTLISDGTGTMSWAAIQGDSIGGLSDVEIPEGTVVAANSVLKFNGVGKWVPGLVDYAEITGTPVLGTAAFIDANQFATAAQGALADTALQPGDVTGVSELDELSDVSYSGGSLEIAGLDQIVFDSSDVQEGSTFKVYANPIYGLSLGDLDNANDVGAYFYLNRLKGAAVVVEDNSKAFWVMGDIDRSDNTPEIRLTTGNSFTSSGATGFSVGFTIDSGLTEDTTYKLPMADGTSGQVLSTDGAGTLSWADGGTGGGGDVEEAPIDGKQYARKDAGWVEVQGSGGSDPDIEPGTRIEINLDAADGVDQDITGIGSSGRIVTALATTDMWVTLYVDTASRTADSSRTSSQDPVNGSGVTVDLLLSAGQKLLLTPDYGYWNNDSVAAATVYAKVRAYNGSATTGTLTLGAYPLIGAPGEGGGGGGAVDSVNGQTGVVSLGLDDLNDMDLPDGSPSTYASWSSRKEDGEASSIGEWSYETSSQGSMTFCHQPDSGVITNAPENGNSGRTTYVTMRIKDKVTGDVLSDWRDYYFDFYNDGTWAGNNHNYFEMVTFGLDDSAHIQSIVGSSSSSDNFIVDVSFNTPDRLTEDSTITWNGTAWVEKPATGDLIGIPELSASFIDSDSNPDTTWSGVTPDCEEGDLLLACVMSRSGGGGLVTPAGWTLVGDYLGQISFSGQIQTISVYTKIATASEPYQATWTQPTASRICGYIVCIKNGDPNVRVNEFYGNATDAVGYSQAGRLNLVAATWVYSATGGPETYSVTGTDLTEISDSPNTNGRLSGGYTTASGTVTSTHISTTTDNDPNHGLIVIEIATPAPIYWPSGMTIDQFKTVVAASSDFDDFKTRVAAL